MFKCSKFGTTDFRVDFFSVGQVSSSAGGPGDAAAPRGSGGPGDAASSGGSCSMSSSVLITSSSHRSAEAAKALGGVGLIVASAESSGGGSSAATGGVAAARRSTGGSASSYMTSSFGGSDEVMEGGVGPVAVSTVTRTSYSAGGGSVEAKRGSSVVSHSPAPKERKSLTTMAAALSEVFDGQSKVKGHSLCGVSCCL